LWSKAAQGNSVRDSSVVTIRRKTKVFRRPRLRIEVKVMNMLSRQIRNGSGRAVRQLTASLAVLFLHASCTSGDGVQIGTGQDPDPVIVDFPIAFVRAPLPLDDQGVLEQSDVRELITFNVGADLYFRDRASPSASDTNITERVTTGIGDVRDVEIAYDGSKLLFAMRGPADLNLDLDDENQPTWNIWEYEIETDTLRRVIVSNISAELGHDLAPHYLPDGRIIFSSTRQSQANGILVDEGKPQFAAVDEDRNEFAFVLHVMNPDGTNIQQVSYNQSHDFDPSVLSNGQVVFSRWDNMGGNNVVNLHRMNPDGSGLELLYGQNSHDTGTNGEIVQFMQPRELEDGRIMALVRPFTDTAGGGDIFVIDTPIYLENTQPNKDNPGMPGPAQQPATTVNVSTLAGVPSPGGRYSSVFPIQDGTGRLIVSWSQCRVIENLLEVPCTPERLADPLVVEANPVYGIWIYDPRDGTQLPVVPPEAGFIFPEVVAADPRTAPPVILDGSTTFALDPDVASEGAGVVHIRSVYDFDGVALQNIDALADPMQTTADLRPARFLRIVKAVSLPDEDTLNIDIPNTAFGRSAQQGMKEILGYTMVEPDGSAMFKVPANVAFAVSVLDADGHRITARHQNWMQVRPGQLLECNGCHFPQSGVSHGRGDAFDSAWAGAQASTFPNTDPAMLVENLGDTMAYTRAFNSCANDNCSSLEPSINVEFTDVWTDTNLRAADPDISYSYLDLTTPAPLSVASDFCLTQPWTSRCRIVTNYTMHVQPLWEATRSILDAAGNPVLDANGMPMTNCLGCHSPVDAAGAVRVPAGQLDLSGLPSPDEADHLISYRELLFPDDEQELNMGALQDRLVDSGQVDANGNPILVTVTVNPSMSVAGANLSGTFFSRFDGGSHATYGLSDAEKRLIAEWLDVGAQYWNNPFDVPQN
jgi:hypothetical protein